MVKKIIAILLVVVAALMSVFLALKVAFFVANKARVIAVAAQLPRVDVAKRKAAWKSLKRDIAQDLRGFDGQVGLVIRDLRMNWDIVSNKDLRVPAASIVKIPVMMAYYEAAHARKLDLSTKVTMDRNDKAGGSGSLKEAPAGSQFSLEELIEPMITESDNTATNLLIEYLGFGALNAYFQGMGLQGTDLRRKMMDFKERRAGVENYTTAADMAYLLERLYGGVFVDVPTSRKCLKILARQKMKDRIPKYLPKGTVVAHKTGLENGLCHDAGIVYTPNGAFVIAVLTRHHYPNAQAAKKLIANISARTYNYLNEK